MATTPRRKMTPVPLQKVNIEGGFWARRAEINRTATIPHVYRKCKQSGRMAAFKLDWKPGQPYQPSFHSDSDVAKWLEAAAYSLATHPDPRLERRVDRLVDLIASAQQRDGYLHTYFTVVEPKMRWKNLFGGHELYCAGHFIEAAVAYWEATGKRKLLDVMCRCADNIARVFGRGKGQKRGYPGHPELEPALVKLYRATGEERYLELAEYFINERGRRPHYFDAEFSARGEDPKGELRGEHQPHDWIQAHVPVREQTTAEGHAVRGMYLYCGMADVAVETGNAGLLKACRRIWKNMTERRMYVTGGVGSMPGSERFTCDYDLPNEKGYAETCAAIGVVLFAHRMLQIDEDGAYADVMEQALYNGVLSGVSLAGKQFFYANHLAAHPQRGETVAPHLSPSRQSWFRCPCCPANVARLLASLGTYVYSQGKNQAWVHLYAHGRAELDIGGKAVVLEQKTRYPWTGLVRISVRPEKATRFTLALRIPGWCRDAGLKVNGKKATMRRILSKGYAKVTRIWHPGDKVELMLPMPVERVRAHPLVRENRGRVALQRGPVIYCIEEVDNGPNLDNLILPRGARLRTRFDPGLLGGVTVISGRAQRPDLSPWKGKLYQTDGAKMKTVPFRAIPYFAWSHRRLGEMLVWVRSQSGL